VNHTFALMDFHFHKYHGTGNDFILVDNRSAWFQPETGIIRQLCDRHFGIGSDGLILIESDEETDFYMNFYNPDGTQSFCGNGSRCAIAFFHSLVSEKQHFTFTAIDGVHAGRLEGNQIAVSMCDVWKVDERSDGLFIHTGSPHLIRFTEKLDQLDLLREAREIRYSSDWVEEGVNVNFVEQQVPGRIRMRTYERGVEGETLSCGTGVTAAAIASHYRRGSEGVVVVDTSGGVLTVTFSPVASEQFSGIELIGPAVKVFEGYAEI